MTNKDTNKKPVEILLDGFEKECSLIKEMDKEDGIDISDPSYVPDSLIVKCLSAFENYRKIRIEEAYFSKIPNNLSAEQKQQKLMDYDRQRRNHHNTALSAVNMLNRVMQKLNLPELYNGPIMTNEEIQEHTNFNKVNSYTDFFLDLINDVENISIERISNQMAKDVILPISKQLKSDTRGFGLKKPFLHDNEDIVFDDLDYER